MPISPNAAAGQPRPDIAASLTEFDLLADQRSFIGLKLFPVFEADESFGKFPVIPIEELLKSAETSRASGANYARIASKFGIKTFQTEEHGVEYPVDERSARVYRNWFDAELAAAMIVQDVILRQHEQRVVAKCLDTNVFGNAVAVGNWSTKSTDIVAAIDARREAIFDATGLKPNTLTVNWKDFQKIRSNDTILERLESAGAGVRTTAGTVSPALIAEALDLRQVLVSGSPKNTAGENEAASISDIWTTGRAFLGVVATTSMLEEPCVGRTFHWGEDGSTIGGAFETYEDKTNRSTIMRCRMETDERELITDAGVILDITQAP